MCNHELLHFDISIVRLIDLPGQRRMMEVHVKCQACEEPFQFLGLPLGLHLGGSAMSVDGLEARLMIVPSSEHPNPLQQIAHDVQKNRERGN